MNCMYRTLLATVALAFSSVTASADTITVCADGCDYTSINAAIAAASDGDVIQLSAETYFEGSQIDTLGKAITLRGVLYKAGEPASVLDGAGTHRVLICQSGEGAGTIFERLVIRNGLASGNFPDGNGGGMLNQFSNPTLTNCTFTGNSATYQGGGMYNSYSSPTMTDCTFTGNSADDGGGMFNNSSSSPTLTDCTFADNSADFGGGMYNNSSNSTLTACTLCGNAPTQVFGGFTDLGGNCLAYSCDDQDGDGVPDKCAEDGVSTLLVPSQYAAIEDAVEAAGYGDVVLVEAGTYFPTRTINPGGKPITIRGSVDARGTPITFIDGGDQIRVLECSSGETSTTVFENLVIQNGYSSSGGGMLNQFSNPTLTNCTFTGNSAEYYGGGMDNIISSPTLTNCTFASNSADYGGGMRNNYSSSNPTLTNCTFTNNSAERGGGGMFNRGSSSPILIDCTFTECCQVDPPRSFVDGGGNDYESWCDDCRADVNCRDNAVNAADLGILIGSWGTSDTQCDINGDGTVSAADLGLLIGAWGPCP